MLPGPLVGSALSVTCAQFLLTLAQATSFKPGLKFSCQFKGPNQALNLNVGGSSIVNAHCPDSSLWRWMIETTMQQKRHTPGAGTFVLHLSSSRTRRNKCLLFRSYPVRRTALQQHKNHQDSPLPAYALTRPFLGAYR